MWRVVVGSPSLVQLPQPAALFDAIGLGKERRKDVTKEELGEKPSAGGGKSLYDAVRHSSFGIELVARHGGGEQGAVAMDSAVETYES